QQAGRAVACQRLEEALAICDDQALRAELVSQLARAHAALFRWIDAVRVLDQALVALRDAPDEIVARLESQLIAAGLQDARTAPRALEVMQRLLHRQLSGATATAVAAAQGMVAIMTGQPAHEAALPLETALARLGSSNDESNDDWDTQAALWWCLITAERFTAVETALQHAAERAERSGSSRGLVAVQSTLALLKYRLGDLPEADGAARIALRVMQEGDFTPGLAFAATILADVAVASGALEEAQALLDLLPQGNLPAGVGSVLIPAARGRLRLAQGRAREALAEFEACMALWHPEVWRLDMRDAGYLHARSGAAQALLALGDTDRARALAEAELADARRFGGPRALGVALRVAGLARGGEAGLGALEESVASLGNCPAALERAASLVEWGAALRRAGRRREARPVLAQGLDAAARSAARPLAARAREELKVAGGRPRRDFSIGLEALTPSELRIVRLAHAGHSNRAIAQRLYLAIKTVEGHLARAYGKLGIATRGELDKALAQEKSRVATR
ncbi:MAG: helix-turn-helix transcriptional regulator, partial [Alphaproteobacteria bacterium]|nr:helix-turn-helix transcriptional regulator [Alphaproteobacteria bacterium]